MTGSLAAAALIAVLAYPFVHIADVLPGTLRAGLLVAAVCFPVWIGLARARWDGAVTSALLGLVVAGLVYNLNMMNWGSSLPMIERLAGSLMFGSCGAIAGLVTYFVGRFTAARAPRPKAGTAPRPSA